MAKIPIASGGAQPVDDVEHECTCLCWLGSLPGISIMYRL
jgi:hypothetical protein